MALIGKIRKHSAFLLIVIGIALAAFILGDFTRKRSRGGNYVGKVNGDQISISDFNSKVDENINMQKLNSGKDNLTAAESFNIKNSTWNQMVMDMLLNKEYEKLGLNITTEELDDQIRGKNPHQYIQQNFRDPETGQFNPALVNNFLQNLDKVDPKMKERYLYLEKAIKIDRLETKFKNLITKGYYVPKAFAQMNYEASSKLAQIRYFAPKYQAIPDNSVKLTDEDFQKYYDENKYKFDQEASRDLDYVVFDVTPSATDVKKITDEVNKLNEEFKTTTEIQSFINSVSDTRFDSTWHKKGTLSPMIDSMLFNAAVGQFYGPYQENNAFHIAKLLAVQMRPDSMKASHILISFNGANGNQDSKRTKKEANRIADSICSVVKKDAAKFDAIAKSTSDDPSAKKNNGDLGWFADGSMVGPFNEAVLKGKVGDYTVVESPFGYHVIKITGKKEPVKKIKVAMLDRIIEPGNQTFQDIYVKASSFQGASKTMSAFENNIKKQNLNKREAQYVREMDNTIAGLTSPRELIRWAYNADRKKGDVSTVFDVEGAYVVAVVKEIREKGISPLEQIKKQIEPLVKRDKKAQMLTAKLNSALAKTKDLNALAAQFSTKVDTASITFMGYNLPGYGRELSVIGRAFSEKPGVLSKPIKGEMGVFVVLVDKYQPAPPVNDYNNMKNMMMGSFSSQAANQIFTVMKDKAKIKDNRLLIY